MQWRHAESIVFNRPSGTLPLGKRYQPEKDRITEPENPSMSTARATCYKEHKPSTALATLLANRNLADPSRYAIARLIGADSESGTPGQVPQMPYPTLLPTINTTEQPPSPTQLPSFQSLQLPEVKPRISSLKMNQMASAVMGMSREQAGKSDEDALHVWNLWMNLVRLPPTLFLNPDGGHSTCRFDRVVK